CYLYLVRYELYAFNDRTRETLSLLSSSSSSRSAAALRDAREIDEQGAEATAAGARAKEKATLAHTQSLHSHGGVKTVCCAPSFPFPPRRRRTYPASVRHYTTVIISSASYL
ncbi:Uncharacterized protein FWK35_00005540, partial [Aphis craccivora]